MLNPNRPPRPTLTLAILGYALADVFGLACFAIGASWFAVGKGIFVADFPKSAVEAVACAAGGLLVLFWSVTKILKELAKQAPTLQARYDDYVARQHPEHAAALRETDPPKGPDAP